MEDIMADQAPNLERLLAQMRSELPAPYALQVPELEPLLTREEVATLFRVKPRTVALWCRVGKLRAFRTPGGRHRRFKESHVRALLAEEAAEGVSA